MFATIQDALARDPLLLLLVLVSLGPLAVLCVVIYRLTLHPLAGYPGPFLARATDFYSLYHGWTGERHHVLYALHQKHGAIVRFGPNTLSINTATALHSIYGAKANVEKSAFYNVFPPKKGVWSTHNIRNRSSHARKKRVLGQAFSEAALRGLETHILDVLRVFCRVIDDSPSQASGDGKEKRAWSSSKDISEWSNYLSYDVLGELCFGESFHALESSKNRFVIGLIAGTSKLISTLATIPILWDLGFGRLLMPGSTQDREAFDSFAKDQMEKREKLGVDADRRDFFYYLLNAKDPETGVGFGKDELWGESGTLIAAGSDTTSTTISALFHYLLHNPSTLARLTALIRHTFTNVEDIVQGPQLSSLDYLRACIDEAMRLSPPVPGLLPREVLSGGISIDGHHFLPGTIVNVPAYVIHHNPTYYPDPFAFKPERWLAEDETSKERIKLAQEAFCPFSIGPRRCVGKNMAYLELYLVVARTLWLFDVKLAETEKGVGGEYPYKDYFIVHKDGPMVQFRRREVV